MILRNINCPSSEPKQELMHAVVNTDIPANVPPRPPRIERREAWGACGSLRLQAGTGRRTPIRLEDVSFEERQVPTSGFINRQESQPPIDLRGGDLDTERTERWLGGGQLKQCFPHTTEKTW